MKKFLKWAVIACISIIASKSYSQQSQINLFVADMLKVADDFASPAAEGASYLSGGGWFISAKPLEIWQVDFSVHANVLFAPRKKREVTVSGEDYRTFGIRGAETATIPSALGGQTDVVFEGSLFDQSFEFDAIDGVDKKVLSHPFVQAAVGLPLGSEFIIRFSPQVTVDDVKFSTLGIGLKHNFNQYFGNSEPTDFQFAALASYSNYDVNYAFNPVVVDYNLLGQTILVAQMENIEVDANLWLFQLVSSKAFADSNWEIFGALGATKASFGYVIGGGGQALGEINSALETLNKNEFELKGDLGLNYSAGNFVASSMLSIGKFYNLNVGLHYRL